MKDSGLSNGVPHLTHLPLRRVCRVSLALLWLSLPLPLRAAEVIEADLCIYGGTASGVAAAVQAARMGKTAVVAEFGNHLGGLTSGGLGATDIGNKAAIGGLAREFYHRIALHYANSNAWQFEKRDNNFAQRGGRSTYSELSSPDATMWTFEPHVADDIFFQMVNEAKVGVYFQQRLASVKKEGGRIAEIVMENGKVYRAAMFVDATYEGDLLAKAGVSYTVGREGNAKYNETLNGVRAETPKHQFTVAVDPYRKPGDAGSGLLPFIQPGDGGTPGEGDACVQTYNFRLCYTQDPANRLPHRKPAKYDAARYELLARYLEALVATGQKPELKAFWNPIWMPNHKTDINNNGGFSTDFIGANYAYPDADYATRTQIWQAHEDYTLGFIYFLATSPRVPESMRAEMQTRPFRARRRRALRRRRTSTRSARQNRHPARNTRLCPPASPRSFASGRRRRRGSGALPRRTTVSPFSRGYPARESPSRRGYAGRTDRDLSRSRRRGRSLPSRAPKAPCALTFSAG